MTLTVAGFVLSLLAIVLSVIAYLHTKRHDDRIFELERRNDQRESGRRAEEVRDRKRASLAAVVRRGVRNAHSAIEIVNAGPAAATSVAVMIDGVPAHESEHLLLGPPTEAPRDFGPIGAGASQRLKFLVTAMGPDKLLVAIAWTDESGETGRWESVLSV